MNRKEEEIGSGAEVQGSMVRCSGSTGIEKRSDSRKLFERKKYGIPLHSDNFRAAGQTGPVRWPRFFWRRRKYCLNLPVVRVFHGRLPPIAAVSAYRRHSFCEGIKERRPCVYFKAAVMESGHGYSAAARRLFSFAVVRQNVELQFSWNRLPAKCEFLSILTAPYDGIKTP